MKWPMVRLADIAELVGGSTPSRSRQEYWNGHIPWLTPTDLPMPGEAIAEVSGTMERITEAGLAAISASLLPPGTVLFSSRATIGKLGIAAVPLVTNQGFANFVPSKAVLPKFLAYSLLYYREEISRLAGSTTFKEVRRGALKRFVIPLPPLSEQRRIVEILDQADALRKKRAEADAKAARILPALFFKMFGDPATNPKGWPVKALGEICRVVSGATPRTDRPEYWGGSIQWATPKDLSGSNSWVLARTGRTITEEGLYSCATTLLPKGTVLLTSRAPIGLVAIAGEPLCTNQGFKSLVPGNMVDSWYIFAWCKLRADYLNSLGRGATFAEISKAIVEAVRIPLPPFELQRVFRFLLIRVEKLHSHSEASQRTFEKLFRALLHRAFTGDLTARWREAHMKELLAEMEAQARILEVVR